MPVTAPWICLLLLLSAPVSWAAELVVPDFLSRASQSVVRIEASRPQRQIQIGTGVVVAPEQVATACHVVSDAIEVGVIFAGRRFAVSSIRAAPARDVCIFLVTGLDAVPARVRVASHLKIGETVVAIGFSGGGALRWRSGRIARTHFFDNAYVLQSSTFFTSGASGGPLMDAQGRVVGLLSFRMRRSGPRFYSVPIEWVVDALALENEQVDTSFDASPFWARSPENLPFFMRASKLESEQRWAELRELCVAWQLAEPGSAEPAFIESLMEERVGHVESARDKLEQVVSRDPRHALAWAALARIRLDLDDLVGARQAYQNLARLNRQLANTLRDEQRLLRD